jgi:hypothetical protein
MPTILETLRDPGAFQQGDIFAVHRICHWHSPSTWLSARIQSLTDSPWNHTGVLTWKDAQWHIVEALWHVEERPLADYCDRLQYRWGIYRPSGGLSAVQQLQAADFARSQIGDDYSVGNILRVRAMQFAGMDTSKWEGDKPVTDRGHWICSALALASLRVAGSWETLEGMGMCTTPAQLTRRLHLVYRWSGCMMVDAREWKTEEVDET